MIATITLCSLTDSERWPHKQTHIHTHTSAQAFLESNLLTFSLIRGQIIGQTQFLAIINVSQEKGCWGKRTLSKNERAICLFFCLKSEAGKAAGEWLDWSIRSGVDARPNVICSYNGFDWPAMWEPINIHFSGSLRPPPSIYFSSASTSFLFAFNLNGSAWLECSVV